ncbi:MULTISPECIES: class I SAM-dependent methyltransferase [unclassified Streptomyces]|uniref:class I SAM-dependent methyltransferase n=1 Tax=unclassified Streptomyces TaxID=2593676 RepID=UPI00225224DF|nr:MULTISPECIES: class I SAM-dependent methyltransferase [unclassified Streptomyces]WSP59198.1 class I SAM-dependent methyltransferase [Streptomyces sp. NBC_01241]WSU20280.1 class I SAM-dependent methyltransferase [Streptomyces sp. NBC_01108]MCX4790949.1 class I SAM-dependent methyltransferase [Streptomyces sp. NBC_01221]MCX4793326.1 class I SAM-dependent methyltransferase [Streptomyces sp. NBC_01242]WSJ34766.1 class I SAM-dependent methyltransferase [Streptomyces sp. NBC_01321]
MSTTTDLNPQLESRSGRFFARYYDAMTRRAEETWGRPLRTLMCGGLTGRVLEIGAGTGANLPYYTSADSLVAVEPASEMRAKLERQAAALPLDVTVVDAWAEQLPLPDDEFDTAVCTLVLCTVVDLDAALAEIRRVLRPGGRLIFFEHVRAHGAVGLLQDVLAPLWRRVAGGCHANRRLLSALRDAGYDVQVHEFVRPWPRYPTNTPYARGSARPKEQQVTGE